MFYLRKGFIWLWYMIADAREVMSFPGFLAFMCLLATMPVLMVLSVLALFL